MGPVWGVVLVGFGLLEGGGGGAVGPLCDGGLGLAVFRGEGALDGAREEVAEGGGGGSAVRLRSAPGVRRAAGGVLLPARLGVRSADGGGGGVSTPMDGPDGDGFGVG